MRLIRDSYIMVLVYRHSNWMSVGSSGNSLCHGLVGETFTSCITDSIISVLVVKLLKHSNGAWIQVSG